MTEKRVTLDRRRFIGASAAAVAAGTAATVASAGPASADGGQRVFGREPLPKPIAFTTPRSDPGPPDPFNEIHWTLPGPEGATTQFIEIPSFGPDADPNTIGDFEGFTAWAVVAGSATDSEGNAYDCEFDIRVMQGKYEAENGTTRRGTFAFL